MSRLRNVWSWLPAFRAVAETQNLREAAALVRVAPSALSRSVSLVESTVGRPLFDRIGRALVLNAAGEELLASVRNAMRLVDDGLEGAAGAGLKGPLRIACSPGVAVSFVWPALRRLEREWSEVNPILRDAHGVDLPRQLLRGQLDLGLSERPVPATEGVAIDDLGGVPFSVYCGRGHPLHRARRISRADLARHAFLAPSEAGDLGTSDHWPETVERRVALRVSDLWLAMTVCAEGRLLAVLPDVAVRSSPFAERLRRLPAAMEFPNRLVAARRRELPLSGRPSLAGLLLEALRAELRGR
ncbi:MAG TPA: LysR family transcriptional regulator [Myxococcales bacterium]|nr:LysR family transcriptional regulator [Myxococcales bacterium]